MDAAVNRVRHLVSRLPHFSRRREADAAVAAVLDAGFCGLRPRRLGRVRGVARRQLAVPEITVSQDREETNG